MTRTIRPILSLVMVAALLPLAAPARASSGTPDWVKPALRYLVSAGHLNADSFSANEPMRRRAFKRLMRKTFGGGFTRERGKVTAGEVSTALVRVLGRRPVARRLANATSPDGWDPGVDMRFGSEVVARELGLRHDRPTDEDANEASANDPMRQADVVYAVWQAKTSPDTYSADALRGFDLGSYDDRRKKVVKFALSLVGTPYIWGGEWISKTPAGYPFGAQPHGGVDCSGFVWYVLRRKHDGWRPDRPYRGWALGERSSSDMARATRDKLTYDKLRPGDLAFFAPGGRDASASDVYHVGMYLGRGWMVHSSGSRAGISLGRIGPGSYWHDQFTWGRRVIPS